MVHHIPEDIAKESKFHDEYEGAVSAEPGAKNLDRGANGVGVDGVESPLNRRSPDAANPLDEDATEVRSAEETTRIGRERLHGSGTGGHS